MSAPVETSQPCTECGQTVRHRPLCSHNLAAIEAEAMELQHDQEKLAVRARHLKTAIIEVRAERALSEPPWKNDRFPPDSAATQALRKPPRDDRTQRFGGPGA